ncbi:hypothetical protein [Nonomuraea sp. NPDC049141]|uniref:hypothetical protein n=1 Tax=Nonomuraea sp. NPDC049141 TaxID=3155500 RepID=UPI0033CC0796
MIGVNVLDVDPDKVVTDARAVGDTVPNLTTLSENADSTMGRATDGYEGRSATALAENWQRNGGGLHRGTRRKGGQPTRRPRQPRAGRAGRPVEPVRERTALRTNISWGKKDSTGKFHGNVPDSTAGMTESEKRRVKKTWRTASRQERKKKPGSASPTPVTRKECAENGKPWKSSKTI